MRAHTRKRLCERRTELSTFRHARTYARTRTHTDAHGRTRTHTDAHGRTRTHTHAHARTRTHTHAHARTRTTATAPCASLHTRRKRRTNSIVGDEPSSNMHVLHTLMPASTNAHMSYRSAFKRTTCVTPHSRRMST